MFAIAHTIEDTPRHNPHNKIYSLIRTAETNTVTLRNLGARTQWSNIAPFYEDLATVLGISVKEYEKWITITVPAILPNRNRRDNLAFITRPLRSSLVKFQREHPLERFRDCVVCIVHQYDEAMSLRRVRDYDNIETKRYLDVIESVMLTNDNGLLLTVLQTTELGDRDCTEFYLIILQSQSQLKAIYKDAAEIILDNADSTLFLGGRGKNAKDISDNLGRETIDSFNTSENRGTQVSHGLTYQKLGKELMTQDEIAVMDGGKCILQLRGVRPFLSDKYDITKHPNYKYLSDFDKKNAFDVERYMSTRPAIVKPDEAFDIYEIDLSDEDAAAEE